jgi:protein SCO1
MNELAKFKFLLLLLLGLAIIPACSKPVQEPPLKGARIGGPFTLTDQNGRTVHDTDFKGKYRIVYFGYTFCPDACPTDLGVIGQALKQFEKADPGRAARVQPIFITVDPARDTPKVLKDYVAAFHPRLIGLTGTPDQIAAVQKAYAIYSTRHPTDEPNPNYLVDHSRQAYLMSPDGEPMVLLPTDQGAQAVADTLNEWVR